MQRIYLVKAIPEEFRSTPVKGLYVVNSRPFKEAIYFNYYDSTGGLITINVWSGDFGFTSKLIILEIIKDLTKQLRNR